MGINDITVGASYKLTYTFEPELVRKFCELVDDYAPVHIDKDHAKAMGYDGTIVHGLFVTSNISGILGNHLPGSKSVINSINVKMLKPVYVGETVNYHVSVKSISVAVKAVTLDFFVENSSNQKVITGSAMCSFPSSSAKS